MGFKSVYRCLQEVFPEIDSRLLRAVAIEHSKDVDAAVNDIITEVIPYMAGPSNVGSNSAEVEKKTDDVSVPTCLVPKLANHTEAPRFMFNKSSEVAASSNGSFSTVVTHLSGGPSSDPKRTTVDNSVNANCIIDDDLETEFQYLDEVVDVVPPAELSATMGCDELVNESGVLNESDRQLAMELMTEDIINGTVDREQVSLDESSGGLIESDHMSNEFVVSKEKTVEVDAYVDFTLLEPRRLVPEFVPHSVLVETDDFTPCDLQSELHCDHPIADSGELQVQETDSFDRAPKNNSAVDTGGHDDAFASNSAFTQSGQICSTDFLDDIIENAKNNKKTLFSVMDSVMNMMKEVELQERAAQLVKEEAALGGIEILAKVEDLKQMLAHAKEANDMHAGEVYGEKAILATEARELQSRLLCLSDERDKSLATLYEMQQTLEARLAAAAELKKAAEQDKLRKEESARNALAEQEAIMAKVVQESKLLEQEAEENAKLRDYLVDRGHTVDVLQGEISVICQDVRLLKEKFDNRVPLSMSVSSSQTTCKLASSVSSSMRSLSSVLVPEEPESCKIPEAVSLIGDVKPKCGAEEDFVKFEDEKIDDEWDILDKDEDMHM